jgi:MFS family permease
MFKRLGLSRNLSIICGTIFINVFVLFAWTPLLPLHLRALGANEWEVGVSFTLMGVARTLFAVFGGALADRYGRKRLLVAPTFATIPLYFVAGITGNWIVLVALLISANALAALQWPAFAALVAESAGDGRVARSYSLTEFSVLAGLIGGPMAGAALLGMLNIPALILLNAIALIGTAILRAWGLQEKTHRATSSTLPKLRTAIDSNVRWFILMGALIASAFSISFGPYFAILARDAWHNSEAEINLLFAAGNSASMLGIVLGRLSDRWGARRVLILGALGYGVSAIAWGVAPTWQWGLLPLFIAFGFSEAAFIAQQTLQAEITTRETRTSVFGIIATTTGVIGGLGPTLGAWLITLGGNPMPFIAAGVMGLLAILAVSPIRKQQTASTRSEPQAAAQAE